MAIASIMSECAYQNHRKQHEPSRGGLTGSTERVQQVVNRGCCENETAGQITDNGNMVGLDDVGSYHDKDAANHEKHVNDRPPCERGIGEDFIPDLGVSGFYLANDAGNKCYYPRELYEQ